MLKNKKGFTLIELMVVISIISFLASVVMASLDSARAKSRDARRSSDIHQIQIALELYRSANGSYPSSVGCGGGVIGVNWCNSVEPSSWTTFQSYLSPYMSKVPIDPKPGVSGVDWGASQGAYSYFGGGTFYMLVYSFETQTQISPGAYCSDGSGYNYGGTGPTKVMTVGVCG
jgi:type II secretion system protein G